MAVNVSRKKALLRAIIVIVAIFAVLGLVYAVFLTIDAANKKKEAERLEELRNRKQSYVFFEPDYDLDIFEDKEFVQSNRGFAYTDGPMTITLSNDDLSLLPPQALFIHDYLQHATYGRADELNAMYSKHYWESHEKLERFTMQKIYNIEAELLQSYEIGEGSSKLRYDEYRLGYMIKNNNGTFRNDQPEDSIVRQWVQVITYPDAKMEINAIDNYAVYAASQQK